MQRRRFLRRTAALSALPALSARAATAATDSAGSSDPTTESTPTDTPTGYAPLGSLSVEGTKEIVVDGDIGYLAVGDGYAVVDLAEPANPKLLTRETGLTPPDSDTAFRYVWDVKVADDRLLVPAQGVSEKHELGFAVVDVSDPANPTTVFVESTSFSIHNAYLDGTTAYLTGGSGDADTVTIYDVSGDSATKRSSWALTEAVPKWEQAYPDGGPAAHDLWVAETDGRTLAFLACWDAGTWILDVSDPNATEVVGHAGGLSPEKLASLSEYERDKQSTIPPGNAHYVTTDESVSLLLVGGESWGQDGDGGPSGIDIYDIADPSAPEKLSSIAPPETPDPSRRFGITTTAHNFDLHDGILYSAWYRGGVKRHDLSDPSAPEQLTYWREPDTTSFWTAQAHRPGETFVATSRGVGKNSRSPEPAGVYVFPDESGRSVAPYESASGGESTGTATGTRTATGTETTTDGGISSASPTATQTPTQKPTEASPPPTTAPGTATTETTVPGFGAVAAVGGFGVALWRRIRTGGGVQSGDDE